MKTYPFSVRKNDASIMLAKDYLYCLLDDVEAGLRQMPKEEYSRLYDFYHGPLMNLIGKMNGGPVVYLTGPELGMAKELVAWADIYRAERYYEHYGAIYD